MTATNHALTGATIGLLISNPLIALPAALLSHFICDALPHYGGSNEEKFGITSDFFKKMLIADASLCLILVGVLAGLHPHDWLLAGFCAFLATSPDLAWINRYVKARSGKNWQPSLFAKFASRIQWFQKPIGGIIELVWALGAITVLNAVIK